MSTLKNIFSANVTIVGAIFLLVFIAVFQFDVRNTYNASNPENSAATAVGLVEELRVAKEAKFGEAKGLVSVYETLGVSTVENADNNYTAGTVVYIEGTYEEGYCVVSFNTGILPFEDKNVKLRDENRMPTTIEESESCTEGVVERAEYSGLVVDRGVSDMAA